MKRPIVFLLMAFILGILCRMYANSICFWVFLSLLLLLNLVLFFCFALCTPQEKVIYLIPVLFLSGYVNLNSHLQTYPIEELFEESIHGVLIGTITELDVSCETLRVTMKDCEIKLEEDMYECGKVLIYLDTKEMYRIGNQLRCEGSLKKFTPASNPGQFDEKAYNQILGYDYKFFATNVQCIKESVSWLFENISRVKNRMLTSYQSILDEEDYGLIAAMLLGEDAYMDEKVKELYQKNGISHILSISGLHITLLGMGVFTLLKKARIGQKVSIGITILFIFFYGLLTGFHVSTKRAVVMLIISLCALLVGKSYDIICAMSLSAFLILLQNPLQLFSTGFLLSYSAIFGIVLLNRCLVSSFLVENKLLKAIFISFSAQMTTLPLVLYFFYEFPLYSVLLNMVLLPCCSFLVGLAFIAGLLGCISTTIGGFCIGAVHYLLLGIKTLCELFALLPGCTQTWGKPKISQILLSYIVMLLLTIGMHYLCCVRKKMYKRAKKCGVETTEIYPLLVQKKSGISQGIEVIDYSKIPLQLDQLEGIWLPKQKEIRYRVLKCSILFRSYVFLALGLLFSIVLLYPKKVQGLKITMLDVGQGDGMYIESGSGNNILIDGGSSSVKQLKKYRLLPFLKSKGKTVIDVAIITHPDTDHVSGILELITTGYAIKTLILPDIEDKDEAYLELEDAAFGAGVSIHYMTRGEQIVDGNLTMTCLHPFDEFVPSSANSYSIVLSLQYGEFQMLLTGDLEDEGERSLIRYLKENPVDYDVLKVAHHGSEHSTSEELLALIDAEYALISVGRNNVYGHPGKELLRRLEKAQMVYDTTKDSGAIVLCTDGRKLTIKEFLAR